MNITIDCRMINSSGIGVYLRECLPCFFKSENHFLLVGNQALLQPYLSNKIKIVNCNIKPFSINELFFFPPSILKQINKTDIFYSPFFNLPGGIKIPVYTTIHDIIFPDVPELSSKAGLAVRMWFFRRTYKISKKIFTVSEFSKSRIEYHLGKSKPVVVTYSAIRQILLDYRSNIQNIKKENTIVFIGNLKKHKDLNCLLNAFEIAIKEGLKHKLIIIGSGENLRTSDKNIKKKIKAIGEDVVSLKGFITDDTLKECLASASLLVQPSLYEGFCLPPLEAMLLGTNALTSDIPVLKEIYSDYPVTYFKAGSFTDLKEKIISLLLNKETPSPVLSKELIYKYTFDKTAAYILKEFE